MLLTDYQNPSTKLSVKATSMLSAGDSRHRWRSQSQPVIHLKERCGGGALNSRSGCGMWKPKGAPCPHCQSTAKQFGLIDTQQSTLTPTEKLRARLGSSVHVMSRTTAWGVPSEAAGLRRYNSVATGLTNHEAPATRRPVSVSGGGRISPSVPISRFDGEAKEMNALADALRDAATCRTECAQALDSLAADFEREFRPGVPSRSAASAIVVKSSTIASRLSTACNSLEAAAATCLQISRIGAVERESMIDALQDDAIQFDVKLDEAKAAMRRVEESKSDDRQLYDRQAHATASVMAIELQRAEEKIDSLRAEVAACRRLMSSTLDEERAKVVAHLQQQAMKRMLQFELARGWTSWMVEFKHGKMLKRRALLRFRHGALHKALTTWVGVHPPMSRIRRAIEPYRQQIAELERELRKERLKHGETRTELEARLCGSEEEMKRRRAAEKQQRVQHLLHVAVRRTLKMELARGWSQWLDVTKRAQQTRLRALARFRSQGLYKALRTWRMVYPPRHLTPESLIACQEALERERVAHEKSRTQMVKLREKWEAKFNKYREAVQTAATLQSVVRELQSVLKEALDASSWSSCRMVLYHEHLRYVPSAATHGRGGRWRAAAARKHELDSRLSNGWSVGRLVDGSNLEKVLTWPSSLRDTP